MSAPTRGASTTALKTLLLAPPILLLHLTPPEVRRRFQTSTKAIDPRPVVPNQVFPRAKTKSSRNPKALQDTGRAIPAAAEWRSPNLTIGDRRRNTTQGHVRKLTSPNSPTLVGSWERKHICWQLQIDEEKGHQMVFNVLEWHLKGHWSADLAGKRLLVGKELFIKPAMDNVLSTPVLQEVNCHLRTFLPK